MFKSLGDELAPTDLTSSKRGDIHYVNNLAVFRGRHGFKNTTGQLSAH
jgi:hypothetical protein